MKELYLVVCATPSKILPVDMVSDFRSSEQEQFPYKVKLEGCEPLVVLTPERPRAPGKPHLNGGGFVANSAQVEATVFVGPNAQVLGKSAVTGQSRIEDFAVVNNAKVTDSAVVSGYATITENACVADNAKVRDCATVAQATTVRGNARILEHASIATKKTCADYVTVKGIASVYGGSQSGTAMIDGFYAKGNEINKGKWFTWSWGQGKNAGEVDEDFGGLYADYDFETPHSWMAKDAFGATWGYLVGAPQFQVCADKETKRSVLLKPEAVLTALDREQHGENNYAELMVTFLRPPETGDYVFWISADDEGELWLGAAGGEKADKKLCSNPAWAGFRDYKRFPSQKSAPVRLEAGKVYPLHVLHSNGHMGGSLSVSWTRPGADKPEPIPAKCLAVSADGQTAGVRQRIWGGIVRVADLIKRPDYPEGVRRETGSALVLNGVNQFAELPKDIADLHDCTYTIDFKWAGGANDQRLFEFANPSGDSICLCPSLKGKLIFGIRQSGKVEYVAAAGVQPDVWQTVRIVLADKRATLYLNGENVAENTAMTLTPESVRATQCYLGRGFQNGYFNGMIDRFMIHVPSQTVKGR